MRAARAKLLLLLAVFASPAVAAWLSYLYWQPAHFSNYGILLSPQPLELPSLVDEAGNTKPWRALRGKWVLLVVAPGGCDAQCNENTYLARQVRLAQGRERQRIERVFLGPERPIDWPYAEDAYRVAMRQSPDVLANGGLFLVDPLGNLMMAFPAKAQGEGVIRDLRRLLKASRMG
jgi:hypothetical protein